jgi:hypothetical protein
VNRTSEISELQESLSAENNRVNVICGQTGIGKSELVKKFKDWCIQEGHPAIYYQLGDPPDRQRFLQRVLAAWFEDYPKSTISQFREYLLSPDAVDDLLGIVQTAVPEPTTEMGIKGVRNAIRSSTESDVDFPDLVNVVTDVMMEEGEPESPAVVIIDQYDAQVHSRDTELETTFRDIANQLDGSGSWYIAADVEIPGKEITCFGLKPFDHITQPNPGASYITDRTTTDEIENEDNSGFAATQELVEQSGLSYDPADVVELHTRTNGIPLLIATICSKAEGFSLREVLEELPTEYKEVRDAVQQRFLRGLSDDEQTLLQQTSTIFLVTEYIASKRTGISPLQIRQICQSLSDQGKLSKESPTHPVTPAYRCHDFYRKMFMESLRISKRELRLETAIDCIELAAERNRLGDSSEIVALQLDRLIHQIVALVKKESESKIAELLIKGTNTPEEEMIELLSNHVGRESEGTNLEDCLIEVL